MRAADVRDDRRAVGRTVAVPGPFHRPRRRIEGGQRALIVAADVQDHGAPIDERRLCGVKQRLDRRRRFLPDLFAVPGIEGGDDSADAEREQAAVGVGGRRLGTGAVTGGRGIHLERRRLARLPDDLSAVGIESRNKTANSVVATRLPTTMGVA